MLPATHFRPEKFNFFRGQKTQFALFFGKTFQLDYDKCRVVATRNNEHQVNEVN